MLSALGHRVASAFLPIIPIIPVTMILAVGCGMPSSVTSPPAPWHYYQILTVGGRNYRVTHHLVSHVGQELTTVNYLGTINIAAASYAVYRVQGVPAAREVAVRAQQGYLEAVAEKAAHRR